LNIIFFKTIV